MTSSPTDRTQRGFTLAELAVVLVIVGILLGGLIMPLSAQLDARNISETKKTLNEARDALLGFAVVNGRLPCPATESSNGIESPVGGGECKDSTPSNRFVGFLPAATLGLTPTDNQGYAIDGWGGRIRYAVTEANSKAFTTANGMKSNWPTLDPTDLMICSTATGASNLGSTGAKCAEDKKLATSVVAVIYSLGRNRGASSGLDERQNLDSDPLFISHEPTGSGSTNGEFDDMVVWLSPPILYNRLIAAGRLP